MVKARKLHEWSPGDTYHITARGSRGSKIFADEMDCTKMLFLILELKSKYKFRIHAYCLMTNHIHLIIETLNVAPSKIMQSLLQRYSRYYNKKHNLSGHLFQGRYFSKLITTPEQFLITSKYIHRNPVTAGIVVRAEQYPWSSYTSFISPVFVVFPLVEIGRTHSYYTYKPHEQYRKFVEKG